MNWFTSSVISHFIDSRTSFSTDDDEAGSDFDMAADQAKINELVNSEELQRAVKSLLENELKRLEAAQNKENEGHLLRRFAGEVSVTGLTDAIKARHKVIKFLWLMIFLGGLGATAYFVYKVFDEYKNDPTATKVNVIRDNVYTFAPIVLCADTWLDIEKAKALGLSKEGLLFGLRYLIPFEDVATGDIKRSKNISGIQEEFYEVYRKHNFASLIDFFKHIAMDAVLKSDNEREVSFQCTGCVHAQRLEKVIVEKSVCYVLDLEAVDGKLRQSYGLPEYEIRIPDVSGGILDRRAYWKLYVAPAVNQLMAESPYISVYEQQAHSIRLLSENFRVIPHESYPCINTEDPQFVNYSSLSCVIGCVAQYRNKLHGCRVFNLDWIHSRPLSEYCNSYYWDQWPVMDNVNETVLSKKMYDCIETCQDECSSWWWHTSIDTHFSNSLVKEATEWNNRSDKHAIKMRSAKLYFINLDVLAGGVLTFTEVSTYSFQTLIGNIGGTCGIWIGVSVMTLIQLCMFFVERSLDTPQSRSNESKKASANGKEPEQTALV